MPIVKAGIKPDSIPVILLDIIACFGLCAMSLTANGQTTTAPAVPNPPIPQVNVHSDYSLSSTTLTIPYVTYLNNYTGRTQLVPGPCTMTMPHPGSCPMPGPVCSPQAGTALPTPQAQSHTTGPCRTMPSGQLILCPTGQAPSVPSDQTPTSQAPSSQGPGTVPPAGSPPPAKLDPPVPSPVPTTLEITWDNSSGVPLAEWIYVTFEVSYCGAKGTYKLKTAIPRQNGSYKIDQNSVQEFSTWLINRISNLAPTS